MGGAGGAAAGRVPAVVERERAEAVEEALPIGRRDQRALTAMADAVLSGAAAVLGCQPQGGSRWGRGQGSDDDEAGM